MLERNNITDFKRDDDFYARHGRSFYENGDYTKAIKYLLNVPYMESQYQDCGMMIADSYLRLHLMEKALFIYYRLYSVCDERNRATICMRLSEIAMFMDSSLAKYYTSKACNDGADDDIMLEAGDRLNRLLEVERLEKGRMKDVREVTAKLQMKLLLEGKYDAVIELAKNNNMDDVENREAIELSYVSSDKDRECLDFIQSISTPLSIVELCLSYLCLKHIGEKQGLKSVKNKIKEYSNPNVNKLPLCVNILCLAGDCRLALILQKKYLDEYPSDNKSLLIYAKMLINTRRFDMARDILLELKSIDIYDRSIYDNLLEYCKDGKRLDNIQVIATLPYSNHSRIVKCAKHLFDLDEGDRLQYFKDNKYAFYYVARYGLSSEIIRQFAYFTTYEDKDVEEFLDFILLYPDIHEKFRRNTIMCIYQFSHRRCVTCSSDGMLVEYTFPPIDKLHSLSATLFTASCHAVFFFLISFPTTSIDFSTLLDLCHGVRIKKSEIIPMASYMAYMASKTYQPGTTLTQVMSHFMLNEEEFYAFLDSHSLEI